MRLPPNNKWAVSGKSNIFGSLYASFNLDLQSNKGATRVSPRLLLTTNNLTDMGTAPVFQTFTDQNGAQQYHWCTSGKYVWRAVATNGYIDAFAKDTSTGTPSGGSTATSCKDDVSDMTYWGKTYQIVSTRSLIYFYTATTGQWLDVQGGGAVSITTTDGYSHLLCQYGSRVYVTDNGTQVRSFTTPFTSATLTSSGSYFLDVSNKFYPITALTFIKPSTSRIWIGTVNQNEGECYVFAWDGSTATDPNEAYLIPDASGVLACVIKNDSPWIIDNNGRLMYFNGGSFVEAPNGRLPVKNAKWLKNSLSATNNRWIHPNGIYIVDGRINILINNENADNGATIEENIASGVWEYDPEIGWYHKQSVSYHAASSGSVTDYGQNRVAGVGALYFAKPDRTTSTTNGTLLVGASHYSDATTVAYGVWTDDSNNTREKYGYFVTSKIFSSNIQDTWQSVFLRFRKLLDATDSLVVKYRISEVAPTEATITWTDSDTFTTTTDVSAYVAGDEVEILNGTGGGKCAHISSISVNAGTYTVNLDDTFSGVTTGTAKARFQKWIKASQKETSQTIQYQQFSMQPQKNVSPWIQFKVCMQFKGDDELYDLTVINTKHE